MRKNASRSLRQFRTSAATFGRQMFIPCAQKIFYYHGTVRTVSTIRMKAKAEGGYLRASNLPCLSPLLNGAPPAMTILITETRLEIAATCWKQRTATPSNRQYRGGASLASSAKAGWRPWHAEARSAKAANRNTSRLEIVVTPCKQTRKDFLIGTKTPYRSHQSPLT
jgi:hypothetical protein